MKPVCEFHVERTDYNRITRIYGRRLFVDGTLEAMTGVTFSERVQEASAIVDTFEPMLKLNGDEAQRLFDELWWAGFRPKQDRSDGEVAAMKEHIKDLRMVTTALLPSKP